MVSSPVSSIATATAGPWGGPGIAPAAAGPVPAAEPVPGASPRSGGSCGAAAEAEGRTVSKSRRAGEPESRRAGEPESRRAGEPESRRAGEPESRRAGEPESRRAGEPESRRAGEPESRRALVMSTAGARSAPAEFRVPPPAA